MADTTTNNKEVTEVLAARHEQVKELLEQIASGERGSIAGPFAELRRMVPAHEGAEEEVVYPALRSSGDAGRKIAEARMAEEAEGSKVLAALEGMDPGGVEFSQLFQEFREAVLRHAKAEEAEVFPLLQETQTPEGLRKLAEAYVAAEQRGQTQR